MHVTTGREENNQRFNNLLEEARADRQVMDRCWEENNQRFNNLLEEARADRQVMNEFTILRTVFGRGWRKATHRIECKCT